jgi:D-psicose/D-tagatose/L-ribulose 3-epimerase
MKLAISNIAWNTPLEPRVADHLQSLGVTGIEIAPSKVHPKPLEATAADLARYRDFWESRGISIVAMQALLFGTDGLHLFRDAASRRAMRDYLAGICRFAGKLGAKSLVFGSPKNRLKGDLSLEQAHEIAIPFFREIASIADSEGTWLCIEHNPPEYGADFVTTSTDALALVQAVGQPGFGLHLDTGGLTLAHESTETLARAGTWWRHFHISEPNLAPIGDPASPDAASPETAVIHARHARYGTALKQSGYTGWISLEMKTLPDDSCLENLTQAITFARQHYA